MKKRGIAILMAAVLLTGALCSCSRQSEQSAFDNNKNKTVQNDDTDTPRPKKTTKSSENVSRGEEQELLSYQTAFNANVNIRDASVTPCVEPYTVASDLSNIDNLWQFYLEDRLRDKLAQEGFAVYGGDNEFFEVYEYNRYEQYASFITVDSLMHTYHLYFSYLMKNIERNYLTDSIQELSRQMLEDSLAAYKMLEGSPWEEAAKRNVAFFTVGSKLLDRNTEIDSNVKDIVEYELNKINNAEGIEDSAITGGMEDYSQYKPRGYYEGDERLEQYFKAMMWYGRVHFLQDDEELDRSALLITMNLSQDEEAYNLWQAIYDITSFFAGASDDLGINEYLPVLNNVYGDQVTPDTLIADSDGFERFHTLTAQLKLPQINSVPIFDGEDNVILGFRFMGQRFSVDASIMQKLIYSNVKANSAGNNRMLPDVLDVPAALGSDLALDILEQNGDTDYAGYIENMNELRRYFAEENETLWSASLYAGWLNTLRPLLTVKGEGYPMFMQSEEWAKKDLECFAGSFTELKHDTVLYTKQVIAEMGGGGWEQEPDDRGYVEPEPVVYARFAELSDRTAQGLENYGMLSEQDNENLTRLSQIADTLLEISKKELRDETLTDDEYDFIRDYGGSIEHFWFEALKDESDENYISTQECPAALVVDIATDPNGQVLEVATDTPSNIFVIVKVDGKLKIARGSVYSFYQFAWPIHDRLTDSEWHKIIGIRTNDEGNFERNQSIQKPEWTEGYRYKYVWE